MEASAMAMYALRAIVFLGGLLIVGATIVSAIKTYILPRGVNVFLTRIVFRTVLFLFVLRVRRATFEERDRIMAMFAPLTLFLMPIVFLVLIQVGYMCLYWALNMRSLADVFKLSGSSLLTLGYASVDTVPSKILEFSEAMIGLILIALVIAYLPTMYTAFTRRESLVALWEARAGAPPSVAEMIARTHRNGELEMLREDWIAWQAWFAELEESHTSLAALSFFRSPRPEHSWITAAGSVLDSASFILSAVDVPWEPRAAFCIRSGYLALRKIADYFTIAYDPDPPADGVISISRDEFEEVIDQLAQRGVPVKADREQAWHDFNGWRVNYDSVLLALASLTVAPYAPWISDRSSVRFRESTADLAASISGP